MPRYSKAGLAQADRVARFSALHVKHMKDRWAGEPFVLEDFQLEKIIKPIYADVDRQGVRCNKRALLILPRWNGKSELAALLHLYHMFAEPVYGGEQYAFATTKKQAAIIFDTAKRMIQADPLLRGASKIYRSVIEVVETGCVFSALPFDADTSQGFHPSFATGDEVHVMRSMDMVDSMVSGMVGRQEGMFVAITTEAAMPGGTLDQLEELWAKDPRAVIVRFGAKAGQDLHDPKTWLRANPASWITQEMLQGQYDALPFNVFCRLHLNLKPTLGDAARAFNAKVWELGNVPVNIDREAPCIIGVDAAPRRDKTAVVMVQRKDDDVFDDTNPANNVRAGDHHVKAWGFEADPEAGLLNFDELKHLLRQLCEDFNVKRIVVDPAHLFAIMDELQREGLPVEDFPQSTARMIPASMNLYDLVQLGRIKHGGDEFLTRHVLNAGAKETPPSGWRITKVSRSENIDAAIALAMATQIAEAEWALHGPSFAQSGGVHTLDFAL